MCEYQFSNYCFFGGFETLLFSSEYNLKQSMREARFDTRSNPTKPINPGTHVKRASSSIGTHRSNETETLVT